ncbi:MAG: tRNA (N6-isopentenyl adenosine(37)-C2)-methylthiotransferase MiaB [Spirochaetes bacterium]|nr:tRNA (N6-isopentenyl adenosine(37)-C2)-methylthiotransferase MiaB [Spirochaetota bacterium]
MKKTFFIETFGCQMNKSDSELMSLSLSQNGFTTAADVDTADIVIYNTCSVREHAENRVISRIRSRRRAASDERQIIVVAGCMAQRIGIVLIENKIADIVVGPYQSPGIGRFIRNYLDSAGGRSFLSQEMDDFSGRINPGLYTIGGDSAWHRWVTITHGCENNCSYCIVPRVRGDLISFPSAQILGYIRGLSEHGAKEITLLGQNVNQYGTDSGDMPFHVLLGHAAAIPGIERVNFLTSHPKDFNDGIIRAISEHGNISRSIHLPLQSGSDRILKIMNRGYQLRDYMTIVEKIDRELGNYSLSTDLIVGFPGESRDEFDATLRAVESIRFDEAFTYAYSPREGTPAFPLKETISRREKIARLQELIALQRGISRLKLKERIDLVEETIIERFSKKSDDRVMGRTNLNHIVITEGTEDDFGKKVMIKIDGIRGNTLQGTRIA